MKNMLIDMSPNNYYINKYTIKYSDTKIKEPIIQNLNAFIISIEKSNTKLMITDSWKFDTILETARSKVYKCLYFLRLMSKYYQILIIIDICCDFILCLFMLWVGMWCLLDLTNLNRRKIIHFYLIL